mmetsp:Transcript_59118/g.170881  ORF Transcript_59118/g.170881 Transcript_59118/m.170881 type:complete len:269 (+) Transcript_59118:203-1009(+)
MVALAILACLHVPHEMVLCDRGHCRHAFRAVLANQLAEPRDATSPVVGDPAHLILVPLGLLPAQEDARHADVKLRVHTHDVASSIDGSMLEEDGVPEPLAATALAQQERHERIGRPGLRPLLAEVRNALGLLAIDQRVQAGAIRLHKTEIPRESRHRHAAPEKRFARLADEHHWELVERDVHDNASQASGLVRSGRANNIVAHLEGLLQFRGGASHDRRPWGSVVEGAHGGEADAGRKIPPDVACLAVAAVLQDPLRDGVVGDLLDRL